MTLLCLHLEKLLYQSMHASHNIDMHPKTQTPINFHVLTNMLTKPQNQIIHTHYQNAITTTSTIKSLTNRFNDIQSIQSDSIYRQ